MGQSIPQIKDGLLAVEGAAIAVDSADWLGWLADSQTRSFAFYGTVGNFTARKERKQHGEGYWVAYRKHSGQLRKAYLGKAGELTLERLNATAASLANQSSEKSPPTPSKERARPASADGLLRTKLYPPQARSTLVWRLGLLERLSSGLRGKLTLVSAPAGSGKTTLLTAWRSTPVGSQMPLAWVSLEAEDNHPVRFWRYFCAALETLQPDIAQTVQLLLGAPRAPSSEAIATELLNAVAALLQDGVLVLDDYHLIQAPEIHQALSFVLDHQPAQFHLVILSRADPPLPLTRLRARGELTELRANNLRFSPEESRAFLHDAMGLRLSDPDIAALEQRTEGWIAGLQLAALSLQGREDVAGFIQAFAGSHRFIVDYLVEEVLERQAPEIRDFLLQTSILERLCGPLCDAVTGRGDGQAMLERLEAANLFVIPLDDERHWYRYHHLFAEFLQNRLKHQRWDMAELHGNAARWLEQHGLIGSAVGHWRAAASFTELARLVEQQLEWALEHGEFQTLLHWLESIPESETRLRPRLYVFRAIPQIWTGQLQEAQLSLTLLERSLEALDQQGNPEAETIRAEGLAAQAGIVAISGDLPRAVEIVEQALQRLPPNRLALRSALAGSLSRAYYAAGYPRKASLILAEARTLTEPSGLMGFALLFQALEGHAQVAMGQLEQAAWRYREVLRDIEGSGEAYPAQHSLAHLCLGVVLGEWNQLSDATHHLRQGLNLQQYQGNPYFFLEGSLALARVQQAQNNAQAALQTLATAERIVSKINQPQPLAFIAAARALLQLRQGNLAEGIRWQSASGLGVDDPLVSALEFLYRVLARVLTAQGDNASALRLLGRLRTQAESQERLGSVIELLVLEALAHQAKGDKAKASASLSRALTLAQPEGFVRVFVDEGIPMMALLSRVHEAIQQGSPSAPSGVSLRHLNSLLVAGGFVQGGESSLSEPLSQRELEVLRLMAGGFSNKGIARELSIAPSTVKWYINTLFAKLEVDNRLRAVARGGDLGLI